MQRCSESVAAIATALAKAQIELTNPEKTKAGSIYHSSRSDNPQSFRYAPLSGGLQVIRKTLGGHQIAISQSTAIDQTNKIVNLTTTLMHTSGEWISSDWPVCALSETTAPRRMGAALTYARRYSLFALVGVAGEDDPDLDEPPTPEQPRSSTIVPARSGSTPKQIDQSRMPTQTLSPDESSLLRDQLLQRIQEFTTREDLDTEALSIFKNKNTLTAVDAKTIETGFETKLSSFANPAEFHSEETPPVVDSGEDLRPDVTLTDIPRKRGRPKGKRNGAGNAERSPKAVQVPLAPDASLNDSIAIKIDKSILSIGEPRRHRDKTHLRFVALQPCLICGKSPSDAHHLRFAQPKALGRKASDEFVVPLCRAHHRQNHEVGAELTWWKTFGIDPLQVALRLWRVSKGLADRSAH